MNDHRSARDRRLGYDDRRSLDRLVLLQTTRTWVLLVAFLVLAGYGVGQI